jgi:RNA polymerase sigma factor (sigma-70 family)
LPVDVSSDERLVRECLEGSQEAWSTLIRKYKRLIYSIPFRYGATPDDAADIFQAVCIELLSDLASVRKIESLRSWIISVTIHKSYRWKQQKKDEVELDGAEEDGPALAVTSTALPEWVEETERAQKVREAITRLKPRCAEMIRLLFYEDPPIAYQEVARRLGLATGSIGFIRGRCLGQLQKILAKKGF